MNEDIHKKNTSNKLSQTQKDLYDRNVKQESSVRKSFLTPEEIIIPDKFDNEIDLNDPTVFAPKVRKKESVWSIVFWVALVFFLGTSLFTYYSFHHSTDLISNDKILLSTSQFDYVNGGEEFSFIVSITNTNPTNLINATATVEYPELNVEQGKDTNFVTHNLGVIKSNEIRNEEFKLKLFGQTGDKKKITFTLKYNIDSSSETFDRSQDTFVTINKTPLNIVITPPELATIDQEATFAIRVDAVSVEPQRDLLLRIDYPNGFRFSSAIPDPEYGNNTWKIDEISARKPFIVTLKGLPGGVSGDQQNLVASVGSANDPNSPKIGIVYSSASNQFNAEGSLLGLNVLIDGKDQNPGTGSSDGFGLQGNWKNNSKETLRNVEFSVKMDGNAYDPSGVSPGAGYFDSLNNAMLFSATTNPELSIVQPGASGTIGFAIKPSSLILDTTSSIINPKITFNLSASAFDNAGKKRTFNDLVVRDVQVNSTVSVSASVLHYDTPLSNTGPMPPAANKTTQYAFLFEIKNSSNTIDNGLIKFKLPLGVVWTNVYSPAGETLTYDNLTREVAWNIGSIQAGTGYGSESKKVYIQVALTPSTSQIGNIVYLTQGQIIFTGTDSYTKSPVTNKREKLNNRTSNDSNKQGSDGKVVK